ncbi:MAG: pyridoxamine 5'-phosphate oxidase family protein [Ferrimicrobium sp.]
MLDPLLRELARDANFAAFTTQLRNGFPQTSIMWVDCDDDHILINTEVGRKKYTNVLANPKVNVLVWDRTNPYRYIEVRGEVVKRIEGAKARSHIDTLSTKYTGKAYGLPIKTARVLLLIQPLRQRHQG